MKRSILNSAVIIALLVGMGLTGSPVQASLQTGFSCSILTEIPQAECAALVALYNATGGPNWTDHTNWLTYTPVNTWYGVNTFTDSNNQHFVGTLDLSSNNLTGPLPAEIGNLTQLAWLKVDYNNLTGPIPPQLGTLAALWDLRMSYNQFTGEIPTEFGNLKKLIYLYLTGNQLTGSIPDSLLTLPKLGDLRLGGNRFQGLIPAGLATLPNLYQLDLSNNQFSGSIPPELGSSPSLVKLYLQGNNLSGSIPPELGNAHSLQELFLGGNHLAGSIPPEIGNLTQLTDLNLVYNQLTGPIPPQVGKLTNLQTFRLQNNDLSGDLPVELANLTRLMLPMGLLLSYNHFNAQAPAALAAFLALNEPDWAATQTPLPLPGSFSKSAPLNGAANVSITPTLTWGTATVTNSYEYCIDTSDNNVCDTAWVSTGVTPSAAPTGLNIHTTYFWQVRARNAAGTTEANGGAWWRFTTQSVDPNIPQLGAITPPEAVHGKPFWIELSGAYFKNGATVKINNQSFATLYESGTHLLLSLPGTLPAGTYAVSVTNPNNQSATLDNALTILDSTLPDLYAPEGYLFSDHQVEYASHATHLTLVFQRAGGAGAVSNINVAFSARLNDGGAIPVGQTSVASLAEGQWGSATVAWTPSAAGSYELSATIDSASTVVESNETNNTIKAWATVVQAAPVDTTPPTISSFQVDGGSEVNTTGTADLALTATDPKPGSGTTWAYFQTWEFDANLNGWIPVGDSGWLPYVEGAQNHYDYGFSSWPGPRLMGAWAADNAENVTAQGAAALTNTISPSDTLLQNESRWYLFYLTAGQALNVSAAPGTASDVDLYIWPADYPAHPVVASAQDGQLTETLNYSAPANGYYWVEIYGYITGSYTLSINGSGTAAPAAAAGSSANKPVHTASITLANVHPAVKIRMAPIVRTTFLPMILR